MILVESPLEINRVFIRSPKGIEEEQPIRASAECKTKIKNITKMAVSSTIFSTGHLSRFIARIAQSKK